MHELMEDKMAAFDSVKKKLVFDEDYLPTMPYEIGQKKQAAQNADSRSKNPFLDMIDCEDSLPQFQHSASRTMKPAQTQ